MTRRQKRMAAVAALVIGVAGATALGLVAFRKNVMYYVKPSELLAQNLPAGASVELGGMVETGSVKRGDGLKIEFYVTDCSGRVPVRYEGVLPDLFREGQGVIATGHLDGDRAFVASRILAKHDENYMPPDVAKTMHMVGGRPTCATAGNPEPPHAQADMPGPGAPIAASERIPTPLSIRDSRFPPSA